MRATLRDVEFAKGCQTYLMSGKKCVVCGLDGVVLLSRRAKYHPPPGEQWRQVKEKNVTSLMFH